MTEITPEVIRSAWTIPVICMAPLFILDEIIWPLQDWRARRKAKREQEQKAKKGRRK